MLLIMDDDYRDFLHDFFKPIFADMATLKNMKKSRAGRRLKQLERLELKQKEERQRRNREKQREFCREVEIHRCDILGLSEGTCPLSSLD